MQVIGILKRDCLRLFVVYKLVMLMLVLLVMYCMCIPAFIVTSADISHEAICCCLQTCNVYGTWVTLYCICVQIFMVTCANIS